MRWIWTLICSVIIVMISMMIIIMFVVVIVVVIIMPRSYSQEIIATFLLRLWNGSCQVEMIDPFWKCSATWLTRSSHVRKYRPQNPHWRGQLFSTWNVQVLTQMLSSAVWLIECFRRRRSQKFSNRTNIRPICCAAEHWRVWVVMLMAMENCSKQKGHDGVLESATTGVLHSRHM